ncbi:AraC family transcriptional regulator, partial [Vibrio cholerae]
IYKPLRISRKNKKSHLRWLLNYGLDYRD